MLLLHAFPLQAEMWRPQIDRLAGLPKLRFQLVDHLVGDCCEARAKLFHVAARERLLHQAPQSPVIGLVTEDHAGGHGVHRAREPPGEVRPLFQASGSRVAHERVAVAQQLTREQGKTLVESRAEIAQSANNFEWMAEEAKRAYGRIIPQTLPNKRHWTLRHPVGPVATIAPWNFPVLLQARKIAPALAAGCTVVSRPASQTPLATMRMFQCRSVITARLWAGALRAVTSAVRMGQSASENRD